jgi:hypothetical protein
LDLVPVQIKSIQSLGIIMLCMNVLVYLTEMFQLNISVRS